MSNKNTNFDQCIKCTICTVYCPVAKVNPAFPGPKQCGPDGERLRIKSSDFYDEALIYCNNCKRCETACPSDVKIGDIITLARINHLPKPSIVKPFIFSKTGLKTIRDFILSHTDFMGQISTPFANIINYLTKKQFLKKLMHNGIGIHKNKDLPNYSKFTFRKWYKNQSATQLAFAEKVHYFHGCYVNYNEPKLGQDLIKVLNAMNIGVLLFEREKCCGVAMIVNNFHAQAKKNALQNIEQFEKELTNKKSSAIVSTSSTCSFTLQQEYPHLLDVDNSKVAQDIHYITKYLLTKFMDNNIPKMRNIELTIAYHTPCHLEKSGNRIFTIEILKYIPGIRLHILESKCCGLAGTYGFKKENYETSMNIGKSVFTDINNIKPDFVVTDCETCKWQIEENTKIKTIHPVSLIAMAL